MVRYILSRHNTNIIIATTTTATRWNRWKTKQAKKKIVVIKAIYNPIIRAIMNNISGIFFSLFFLFAIFDAEKRNIRSSRFHFRWSSRTAKIYSSKQHTAHTHSLQTPYNICAVCYMIITYIIRLHIFMRSIWVSCALIEINVHCTNEWTIYHWGTLKFACFVNLNRRSAFINIFIYLCTFIMLNTDRQSNSGDKTYLIRDRRQLMGRTRYTRSYM